MALSSNLTVFSDVTDGAPLSPAYLSGKFGVLDKNINEINAFTGLEQGVVTPEAHSAAGDGVTDDTQALNAAGGSAGTNGHIVLSSGKTYLVSSSITGLRRGQRWSGGGVITTSASLAVPVFDLDDASYDNISFLGLRFVAGTGSTSWAIAATTSGVTGLVVQGCTFDGFNAAIRGFSLSDSLIADNRITNCDDWGINIQTGSSRVNVSRNNIRNVTNEHGIYLAGSSADPVVDCIVEGNSVSSTGVNGIKLQFADRCVVANNSIDTTADDSIYLTSRVLQCSVIGNTIVNSHGHGIDLFTSASDETVENVTISGNLLSDGTSYGVSVNKGRMVTITGNSFNGHKTGGVIVTGTGNELVTITGNVLQDEVTGITLASTGTGHRLAENVFSNCTTNISDSASTTALNGVRTVVGVGNIVDGELGLIFQASGMSVIVRSGDTVYDIASATSVAV